MKDVPVGDSPQTQIGSTISYNYKINKNSKGYIKLKGMYFDKFLLIFICLYVFLCLF